MALISWENEILNLFGYVGANKEHDVVFFHFVHERDLVVVWEIMADLGLLQCMGEDGLELFSLHFRN